MPAAMCLDPVWFEPFWLVLPHYVTGIALGVFVAWVRWRSPWRRK